MNKENVGTNTGIAQITVDDLNLLVARRYVTAYGGAQAAIDALMTRLINNGAPLAYREKMCRLIRQVANENS